LLISKELRSKVRPRQELGSGKDMDDRMSLAVDETRPSRSVQSNTLYKCFATIRDVELGHSQTMDL